MTNQFHIELNGCGLMLDSPVEGVAVGSNPFAASGPTGGEYGEGDGIASFVMDDWSMGVATPAMKDGGFLDATLESRFGSKLMLPMRVDYADADTGDCDCDAFYIEHCDRLLIVRGKTVYEWDDVSRLADILIPDIGGCATGAVYFDNFLHIGLGPFENYVAYDFQVSPPARHTGPQCADGFYSFGGILYSWCCTVIHYTNGGNSPCDMPTPPPDIPYDPEFPDIPGWQWDKIDAGPCDPCECVTGMTGTFMGSIGEQRIYIFTPSQIMQLLPGDITIGITPMPQNVDTNGVNALAYYGETYFPTNNGLVRITQSNQFIPMGLDRGEGLPCDKAGRHQDIVASTNWLLSVISPEEDGPPTVWAWSGEGWHFVTEYTSGTKPCNSHYSRNYQRLFTSLDDGTLGHSFVPDVADNPHRVDGVAYQPDGEIDLGWFFGGYRELIKDWHSVYLDGSCITAGQTVDVYWAMGDEDLCNNCRVPADWTLLGTIAQDEQELFWPCTGPDRPNGKRIRIRLVLRTDDQEHTPVVGVLRIRYLPLINDAYRWFYSTNLPPDCLNDWTNQPIEDYDQEVWHCCMVGAVTSVQPIPFTDLDGEEYAVRVTDFSKRIHNTSCSKEGTRVYDEAWTFTLVQVCPPKIAECLAVG